MRRTGSLRPARRAGRFGIALLAWTALAIAVPPEDAGEQLQHADDIKTANNAQFVELIDRLDADASKLTPEQGAYLQYLKAWQLGYVGDYATALPALKQLSESAPTLTLRFRALVSLINDEVIATHYEEAYAALDRMLQIQPQVPDKRARMLGYGVAASLYCGAGQYDLALASAERWIAQDPGDAAACKAGTTRVEALFRSGRLEPDDATARAVMATCDRIGEPVFSNRARSFLARVELQQGRARNALALLTATDAEVQATHSTGMTSSFQALLARSYLQAGDLAQARLFARSAIAKSVRNEISEPLVEAYGVLYEVAKREGDLRTALENHELYAAADKGYLSDATARTLAYQMVSQQVQDKKRQIDALNERNQVLELQEEVARKTAETQKLYITLLLGGLAFIAFWAYRTKRSQVRFQSLSRHDGLTGIVNRQHFLDEAKLHVQQCAKGGRPVSLILIDLDWFKAINDTYGHAAGDAVLRETASACQVLLRPQDIFGRLGGEEFGVLLPDCALAVAQARAEAMRAAIGRIQAPGAQARVSASFGITSHAQSGYDLRQMLIHADSALYGAKHKGRNRVEAFDGDLPAPLGA